MRRTLILLTLVPFIFAGCAQESNDSSSSGTDSDSSDTGVTSSTTEMFSCETPELDSGSRNQLASMFTAHKSSLSAKAYSTSAKTTSFPVYFHVIERDSAERRREVPDEALVEQIDVLNRAYSGKTGGAPTPYRFTMGGINRVTRKFRFYGGRKR